MIKVIGVRFRKAGKVYYFDPAQMEIKMGDPCDRGDRPRNRVRRGGSWRPRGG